MRFSRVVMSFVPILVGGLWGCSEEVTEPVGTDSVEIAAAPGRVPGKPSMRGCPGLATRVTTSSEGTFRLGPLPVRMPVDETRTLEVVATLEGTWRGRGVRVVTASGLVNEQIHFDIFEGILTLEHSLEGIPSPLAVSLKADRGGIQTQFDLDAEKKPEKGYDFRVHVKTLTAIDPESGTELPWPQELGTLPTFIRIRDGVLLLANVATLPPRHPVRPDRFGGMKLGDD